MFRPVRSPAGLPVLLALGLLVFAAACPAAGTPARDPLDALAGPPSSRFT